MENLFCVVVTQLLTSYFCIYFKNIKKFQKTICGFNAILIILLFLFNSCVSKHLENY